MNSSKSNLSLGLSVCVGLLGLGMLLANAAIKYKSFERTVTVKGLSEAEYPANIVIWPIQFTEAENDLTKLYAVLETKVKLIREFLAAKGITETEVTVSTPSIDDKTAQQWNSATFPFRYSASQIVTVYSQNISAVRSAMSSLSDLGKSGFIFKANQYENKPKYTFTKLSEVKPKMIEEATKNARGVAEKFAADSNSKLGKIKRASQGLFSIAARDQSNPHIKKVRVVSTVEYYLSD